MLRSMRHMSQTWLIKAFLILLVGSFAIWGIGDIFRGNPLTHTVATVGDTKIVVQDLQNQFDRDYEGLRQFAGMDFTIDEAKKQGLLDQSLKSLIHRNLLGQEIQRLGIFISQQDALEPLKQNPNFFNRDGSFNRTAFNSVLQRMRTTEAGFLDAMRFDIAGGLINQALERSLPFSKTMENTLLQAVTQERYVDLITIKNAEAADVPAPDDAALQAFYTANAKRFAEPETRDIAIMHLPLEVAMGDIALDDKAVEAAYNERKRDFTKPATRTFTQVVADEDAAKKLAADAKSGGLAAAAKKAGLTTVQLENATPEALPEGLREALFAAKVKTVSEPVKTDLGWHVFEVTSASPEKVQPFAEVKASLIKHLKEELASEKIQDIANKVDDALAANRSLDDIANEFRLKVDKFPGLKAEAESIPASLKALPYAGDVLKQAGALNDGENGSLISDAKGGYFVVGVTSIKHEETPPLEQIKDKVAKAWTQEARAKAVDEMAQRLAEAVRKGQPIASVKDKGVSFAAGRLVSLSDTRTTQVPAVMVPQIMDMKIDEVRVGADAEHHYIAQLARVANITLTSEKKDVLVQKLRGSVGETFAEEFLLSLRERYPVKIKQDVLTGMERTGDSQ